MTTATIEALATGLPVVATTHSGFPDQVVPNKNGYLAREADPEDFAEKMFQFMEHPELWSEMSKNARAHAHATYDKHALIARQTGFYKKLSEGKSIAFVVGTFPLISETFIINQVADLLDLGFNIQIYALKKGSEENISERYFSYRMSERVHVMEMPEGYIARIAAAIPKILHILSVRPNVLLKIFDVTKYGANAYTLKTLFWAETMLDLDADVVHCHFGTIANRYLIVRDILGLAQPIITTFYGFDISHIVKEKGIPYYDELRKQCKLFLVMSNNMKERVAAIGFDNEKLFVLPISIDVEASPFTQRVLADGETIRIISVGRFVEKKGFDDLLRAVALLKKKQARSFMLSIVGGGVLDDEIRALAKKLDVLDVVEFLGPMKLEDIIVRYMQSHLYVQASKTSKDGDME